jgi:uncharacterized membrane protein YgcG
VTCFETSRLVRHVFATVLFALLALADAHGLQDAPKERAKRQIAIASVRKGIEQFIASIDAAAPAAYKDELSTAMLAAPAAHRQAAASETAGRVHSKAHWARRYEQALEQSLREAGAELSPALNAQEVGQAALIVKRDAAIERFLAGHFPSAFREARGNAVAAQRSSLQVDLDGATKTVLSQDAVEKALEQRPWAAAYESFIQPLRSAALPADVVLFEENEREVDVKVRAVLSAAGRQIESQFEAARDAGQNATVPPQYKVTEEITAFVTTKVEETIASTPEASAVRYTLLRPVRATIQADAKTLELSRFERFVRAAPVAIDSAVLEAEIAADSRRHRTLAESLALLRDASTKATQREFAARYAQGDAMRTARFLRLMPALADVFRDRFEPAFERELRSVRSTLAKRQLEASFAELVAGAWTPTDLRIERRFAQGERDVIDAARAFEALGESGVTIAPTVRDAFLDEATAQIAALVERAIKSGANLLNDQVQRVATFCKEHDAEGRKLVDDGIAKAGLISRWTQQISEAWRQEAVERRCRETLFPRTEKEIEKTVGQFYDAVRAQEAARAKAAQEAARKEAASVEAARKEAERVEAARKEAERKLQDQARTQGGGTGADRTPGGSSGGDQSRGGSGPGGDSSGVAGGGGGGGAGGGLGEPIADVDADLIVWLTDNTNGRSVATVQGRGFTPDHVEFQAEEIDASVRAVSDLIWPRLKSVAEAKLGPGADESATIHLGVIVTSSHVRYLMSLRVRRELRSRLAEATNQGQRTKLEWIDLLEEERDSRR